jgi:hypothetical protein
MTLFTTAHNVIHCLPLQTNYKLLRGLTKLNLLYKIHPVVTYHTKIDLRVRAAVGTYKSVCQF